MIFFDSIIKIISKVVLICFIFIVSLWIFTIMQEIILNLFFRR